MKLHPTFAEIVRVNEAFEKFQKSLHHYLWVCRRNHSAIRSVSITAGNGKRATHTQLTYEAKGKQHET